MTLSPVTLGTAQLTTQYGIANIGSDYDKETVFSVLKGAMDNGIFTWDTSPAYGNSEDLIGEYLRINRSQEVVICSKLPSVTKRFGKKLSSANIRKIISNDIDNSLYSLNRDNIDCYFIHDEQDILNYGNKLVSLLDERRKEGKIGKIGISVYSPKIASMALKNKKLKLIQLPCNLFDRRFDDQIKEASINDTQILARSVFLQGLFFLNQQQYTEKFPDISNSIELLNEISKNRNISIREMAFSYVSSFVGISSMVLGVDNLDQLLENSELISRSNMSEDLKEELDSAFINIPTSVLDPSNWVV
jgi:aryl-alcohol dehydrogenase-like predicted oxidoreductase